MSPPSLAFKLSLDVDPSLEWRPQDGICAFIKRDLTGLASSLSPMEGTKESPCGDTARRQIPKTWKIEHFLPLTVDKGYHSHQSLQPSYMSWWTLRKAGRKRISDVTPTVNPEETQDVIIKILAPDSWDEYIKKDFSGPRLLHFPIYRKALNFLTWDIWSSLTIILWHSWLPPLCYKIPMCSSSSLLLLGTVSESYLSCCFPGCIPGFAPNKTTHNAHTELFFFFLTYPRRALTWYWSSVTLTSN